MLTAIAHLGITRRSAMTGSESRAITPTASGAGTGEQADALDPLGGPLAGLRPEALDLAASR